MQTVQIYSGKALEKGFGIHLGGRLDGLYGKGLFSTWAEKLGEAPVLLDAVLIPFQGSIISDGLVVPYQIYFGKGAKEDFKDAYMNAKRNNAIRFSI